MRKAFLVACATLALAACDRSPTPADSSTPLPRAAAKPAGNDAHDEHSFSQPGNVAISDIALDIALDFDAKTIAGTATYTLDWKAPDAKQLVLDTRELSIDKVEGEAAGGDWQTLKFSLAEADKLLGSALLIDAPARPAKVRVTYRTAPTASGLQWLTPEMTQGKQLPFMFSQSQQIHARSWVPLQDTPQVRYTYSAKVTSRPDVMVLMSADNDPAAVRDGEYEFRMPQKIPSYLMAIAAGDLVFKPISPRSGVWAEPAMVDLATAEFADTEKMIAVTEKLYGPYRWDRYDMLVLPPSFPYGGMENPRLTFLTPTVIVGDQSLVSLIAHELAHSWSGNLVTFATSRDAWLNEGVTSYVENRIIEALYGKDRADMESVIARNELKAEFADTKPELQALAVKPGVLADPDENSTATVYTKGAWFMQALEQRFGREVFDPFLRGYFDQFAFQSITSQQFADYAKEHLLSKKPDAMPQAEFDEWLYQPGIPASAPRVLSPKFGFVDSARLAWLGSAQLPTAQLTDDWSTHEWMHFLDGLPKTLTVEQLSQLDTAYKFTGTRNGEYAQRWYPLAVRSGYVQANPAIVEFLSSIGRRKLIVPTYEALVQTETGLALARVAFEKAKPGYHPITSTTVEQIIASAKPPPGSGFAPAVPPPAVDADAAEPADDPARPAADGDATRPAPTR